MIFMRKLPMPPPCSLCALSAKATERPWVQRRGIDVHAVARPEQVGEKQPTTSATVVMTSK